MTEESKIKTVFVNGAPNNKNISRMIFFHKQIQRKYIFNEILADFLIIQTKWGVINVKITRMGRYQKYVDGEAANAKLALFHREGVF